MRKLNAWQIKLIMVFLMLLDHLDIIHNLIPSGLSVAFHIASRCVAPMFGYLAIEGIRHTRNLRNYCVRLWVWAGAMFLGSTALNMLFAHFAQGLPESAQASLPISNNVLITLAAGVTCIACIRWALESHTRVRYGLFTLSFAAFAIGFFAELGLVLLPFMLITYFLCGKRVFQCAAYALLALVLVPFQGEFHYLYILVFPFIALYNGERGPNTKFNKYFFYAFYLTHIWVLALANFWLAMCG